MTAAATSSYRRCIELAPMIRPSAPAPSSRLALSISTPRALPVAFFAQGVKLAEIEAFDQQRRAGHRRGAFLDDAVDPVVIGRGRHPAHAADDPQFAQRSPLDFGLRTGVRGTCRLRIGPTARQRCGS